MDERRSVSPPVSSSDLDDPSPPAPATVTIVPDYEFSSFRRRYSNTALSHKKVSPVASVVGSQHEYHNKKYGQHWEKGKF